MEMNSNVTSFSDNAVTWEPVEAPFDDTDWDMVDGDGNEAPTTLLVEQHLDAGDPPCIAIHDHRAGEVFFHQPTTPDIRLCRAMPAPQWSQSPPDAPGKYWCWMRGWPDVACCRVWVSDRGEVSRKMGHGFYVPRGAWYMPATVPQPPEVGE
jgi:hypothetical protein